MERPSQFISGRKFGKRNFSIISQEEVQRSRVPLEHVATKSFKNAKVRLNVVLLQPVARNSVQPITTAETAATMPKKARDLVFVPATPASRRVS